MNKLKMGNNFHFNRSYIRYLFIVLTFDTYIIEAINKIKAEYIILAVLMHFVSLLF